MGRDVLELFRPAVRDWFSHAFEAPTRPQRLGWPAIATHASTLILAPTGTGKTLTAFLWCLDKLMFDPPPDPAARCRVVYVSPLKALAVDVERNLRRPLSGIAEVARQRGIPFHPPAIAVRTGDTPSAERERFRRQPADILITTPESLFLLLTSQARERLRSIDTVILDEVHAMVSTKRGAHLALSLERLEQLVAAPLQRIGLSATQRPLDEVARFLGGASDVQGAEFKVQRGAVQIVDAASPKRMAVTVQVPVEDMALARRSLGDGGRLGEPAALSVDAAPKGPVTPSIWTAIHPRLLELVRAHHSTLLFANSRRLAERLAAALNELAGESLVGAHHGSLAREQRVEIEELLKAGHLRGLVATSSLELGIDMGAIDLVIQIEAPTSVASGIQRIGRAGHQVDQVSTGIIFPKYRGDLVAAAAVTRAMARGEVEPSRYPRNPLDVLAQQIVAMTAVDTWRVDALFDTVRRAAPYADLSRNLFDGVLDMLSGRYPSDEFAELRPRITWDRVNGTVVAREGAGRVAIANAGTIPDRGLFGVFLADAPRDRARVGELDEEMVFEARPGEVFVLGASSWRIDQITHDRVIVSPAPGEPGKVPFWRGEGPGRPLELGLAIGRLVRELREQPTADALQRLETEHGLDRQAAANLLQYLADQERAAGAVPDDRTLVVERTRDDLGDWRIAVLSALGGRVHAPWVMAVSARIRDARGIDVETTWNDDGFVVRFPDGAEPPETSMLIPDPDEVEALVLEELGSSALFAARFREAAGRALLLPRRRPGARSPLWQLRKRASDLLAVASRFGSFPIVLETYRECLRDVFDLPALTTVLRRIQNRSLRVVSVESEKPSPFSSSLLFAYVANYLYDGDAPLAERRARALSIDQAELKDLIGDLELRELLDAEALTAIEADLQHLAERFHAKSIDAVHDLLIRLGDLTPEELDARTMPGVAAEARAALVAQRRAIEVIVAGERRLIAVEDAARYRDALGTALPAGLPASLLDAVADPLGDLIRRYARTHGPFASSEPAVRFGLGVAVVDAVLPRLALTGRLIEGAFRPGGRGREWTDAEVLRSVRHRSLARLRREIEPVPHAAFGRFVVDWHGVTAPRRGLDALLDVVEQLQGVPLAASLLEHEILPARIADYTPAHLDTLMAAGEVSWVGVESLGDRDGRVALYLTDHLRALLPSPIETTLDDRQQRIVQFLRDSGASFFAPLHAAAGGGFPQETVDALWALVWSGVITNDALHPLRAHVRGPERTRRPARAATFRSRRLVPDSAEGRWDLVTRTADRPSAASWAAAWAQQLLTRHGIVTREATGIESIQGGFSTVYPVLRSLEEAGRVRRGYFVAGLGGAQFAQPGAVDRLRGGRDGSDVPSAVILAATDPANPYGAVLPWSRAADDTEQRPAADGADGKDSGRAADDTDGKAGRQRRGPSRTVGARVVIVDGRFTAWIGRGNDQMFVTLPADEPERSAHGRALASLLVAVAERGVDRARGWLLEEINGAPAAQDPAAAYLVERGFVPAGRGGLQLRVARAGRLANTANAADAADETGDSEIVEA
jgi:ATP-dependent helicase Lhr and Lhr-like helicase